MEVVSSAGQALRELTQALLSIERRPLEAIEARKSTTRTEATAFSRLGSKLSSMRRISQDFGSVGSLSPLRNLAVIGLDSGAFTASARSTAPVGAHNVSISQIAQRHSIASPTLAGGETTIAPAEDAENAAEDAAFTFSVTAGGETTEITISPEAGQTDGGFLTDLAIAINGSSAKVQASVVSVGNGDKRLMIQAGETGYDNRVTAIHDVDGSLMSKLGLAGSEVGGEPLATTVQNAQDALLEIDGLEIRSATNKLDNVLSGVSLNVTGTTESTIFEVTRDEDAALEEIQEFIETYNAIQTEVRSLTRPADDSGNNRGLLAGNSAVNNLRNSMRLLMNEAVESDGSFKRLSSIGITTSREGLLELKESDFRDALQSDPEAVENLFNGENGVGVRLENYLDTFSKVGGIIDQQEEALQRRIGLYDQRISFLEEGLAQREEDLLQRLAGFQSAIGTLTSQQSYLGGLFRTEGLI